MNGLGCNWCKGSCGAPGAGDSSPSPQASAGAVSQTVPSAPAGISLSALIALGVILWLLKK